MTNKLRKRLLATHRGEVPRRTRRAPEFVQKMPTCFRTDGLGAEIWSKLGQSPPMLANIGQSPPMLASVCQFGPSARPNLASFGRKLARCCTPLAITSTEFGHRFAPDLPSLTNVWPNSDKVGEHILLLGQLFENYWATFWTTPGPVGG